MAKQRRTSGLVLRLVPVVFFLVALLSASVSAAPVSMAIKMDYFGYRPSDTKIAIFTADPGSTVEVRDTSDNVLYTIPNDGGSITSKGFDDQPSGDDVWWVDFSAFSSTGSYRLYVPS
ncbi:MAG: cellulase N-terminal Ig-like domain-containing protein, partial [Candidatus Brocadiia bacterium]